MTDLTKLTERLEQCEETLRKSQRIEKEGIAAIASAAAAEKRLEKCETFLKRLYPYMEALNHFHLPDKSIMYASELWDLLYAARPALEGK